MTEYYILPAIDELASGVSGERAAELRARIALAIGNRDALLRVLGDEVDFDNFYPDMAAPKLSTNATIDAFLDRFGSRQETDLLTRMIFDGSAARSAETPEAPHEETPAPAAEGGADLTSQRIDAWLSANPAPEPVSVIPPVAAPPVAEAAPTAEAVQTFPAEAVQTFPVEAAQTPPATEPVSTPALSESLASMMIKNGNYTKALEIILQLSLDMPKKSIYFADQIRFLRKLIANKERLGSAR